MPPPPAEPLPGGPSRGAWGQVFSWAMRSRGVRGRCRPQWGQVQKLRRQSLYRSVSLCASGVRAQGLDLPSPAQPPGTLPWGPSFRGWRAPNYNCISVLSWKRGCSLKPHLQSRKAKGRGGVRAHSEAVVGEEVRDCVAPFGRVGGQGGAAEEAGEAGGRRDGLGSHIEILGFQPREPPEPVGNLTKEREADSASPAQSTRVQPCLKPRPVPFTHGG